jgi:hypothetical protein
MGTLGGYLTPLMLATGARNDPWLFGYLLLLALGVSGMAWRKQWPALTYLCLIGHQVVFFAGIGWRFEGCHFALTMTFLAAYFVVFTTALIIHGVACKQAARSYELAGLITTAAIFYGSGYALVRVFFDKPYAAWVPLAMAAFFTANLMLVIRRAVHNRERTVVFLGLAVGALALTFPLLLSHAWLTLSWAVLAVTILWVSIRLESLFLRGVALTLYAWVFFKLGFVDLARAYGGTPAASAGYWNGLLDRAVQFGVVIVSFGMAFRLLARAPAAPLADRNAEPWRGPTRAVALAAMYLMLFVVLNLEAWLFCDWLWAPGRLAALTLVWAGFCLHALARRERMAPMLFATIAGLVVIGLVLKLLHDFESWRPLADGLVYGVGYRAWGGVLRVTDMAVGVGCLALAWQMWRRLDGARAWALAAGYAALLLLFLHLTFETGTFFARYLPGFRGGAISLCWAVYAFGLILGGLRNQARTLRYLGLGLFGAVAIKVFLVDLADLQAGYRIAACGALGVVLLLAAWLYLRQSRR